MSNADGSLSSVGGAPPTANRRATPGVALDAERRSIRRIADLFGSHLVDVTSTCRVRRELLAALTLNESGGNPAVTRFEPAVYRHLKLVAGGERGAWGAVDSKVLEGAMQGILEDSSDGILPKTQDFHARYLTLHFAESNATPFAQLADEALHQLATSWGLTQIMGYHMIDRAGSVRDLTEPRFHYGVTVSLLEDFAAEFKLDPSRDFEELFRCWNTGRPRGETYDPHYVENGLRRAQLYCEIQAERREPAAVARDAATPTASAQNGSA